MIQFKKIRSFLLLCIGIAGTLNGQVRFQVVASNEGIYTADRLFQFTLLNTSPVATSGQVTIRLTSLRGELVAQYKSLSTVFNGTESQSGTQLEWLKNTEFGASASATLYREQGVLPYGQYVACYTFFDGKTTTSPVCAEIYAKPQMPPRLNSPTDKEVILTTTPLLTWIPPMPDFGAVFQYNLHLVEQRDGQTCTEALAQNPPLFRAKGVEETVYQTSDADGLGLEIGKTYCWQVGAFTKNEAIGNTEMWAFTVGSTALVAVVANTEPYVMLKQDMDAESVRVKTNSVLRVAFNNRFYASNLKYSLRKEAIETTATTPPQYKINLVNGMNYLDIPVKISGVMPNAPYVLELTDTNNIKYYCRFVYEN